MRIALEVMGVQKDGNAPTENEDAAAPEHSAVLVEDSLHVAVADGATESLFSGLWARLLAREYATGQMREPSGLLQALPGLQRRWLAEVEGRELPWYAQEKLREGAFATVLGVSLARTPAGADGIVGTWSALAVGDSCLFQVRDARLVRSFPLELASSFGSRPFLVSTHGAQNARVAAQAREMTGEVRVGDTLLLMTDALAHWFLGEHERGGRPWLSLPGEDDRSAFESFVAGLRAARSLRNDDTTLMRLSVEA
ncbi:protein phosphatase 2C domain-containing protein [Myxococcus sp. K38C18041901]|uniref:protein phosphatase 2C domain-containing protein n=1 Tax=Myxococcus guangdongensis TaxID=2906760 RepID=UPI0020A6ED0F|nr:protein phosphatase 2C domain-containing protein [Myxococcus guangdongensis]MCP3062297.1 protein phosphatase 2C domain-containing protein [Myxococcus guangdongensis]